MSNVSYKTGVTATSLTVGDLMPGSDPLTGEIRYEEGKQYILVKGSGTIADGHACSIDTSLTAATGDGDDTQIVVVSCPADDGPTCFNNTGGSLATLTYFWGLVQGRGYAIADGTGIDNGEQISVESTAGEVMENTDSIICGIALEDGAASTSFKVFIDCRIANTEITA